MLSEVSMTEALNHWSHPERVVLAVSTDGKHHNIIALGWKMKTSHSPPMVAISVGKTRHSHKLISQVGEFVLAIPGEDLWRAVLVCGTTSGRNVDKFKETGLTPRPAKIVKPPLIEECIANIECKVTGRLDTGDHTIYAGQAVCCWVSDDRRRNLLTIGRERGYRSLGGGSGYRFGVIKKR